MPRSPISATLRASKRRRCAGPCPQAAEPIRSRRIAARVRIEGLSKGMGGRKVKMPCRRSARSRISDLDEPFQALIRSISPNSRNHRSLSAARHDAPVLAHTCQLRAALEPPRRDGTRPQAVRGHRRRRGRVAASCVKRCGSATSVSSLQPRRPQGIPPTEAQAFVGD